MITYITPDYIRGGNEYHNQYLEERYKEDKHYFDNTFKIFLAGTIDNGESDDWQYGVFLSLAMYTEIFPENSKYYNLPNFTVFSPRRKNWNKNFSKEELEEQIRWEQEKLDEADLIVMVLKDDSKSPISLLELGLYGPSGKLICFCTENFYRFTNVEMTCNKWLIPLYKTVNEHDISAKINDIYKEIKN